MAKLFAVDGIEDVLGDVLGMISEPLQRACSPDHLQCPAGRVRLCCDKRLQLSRDFLASFINSPVFLLDGGGGDVTGVVDALVMDVDVDAVAVAGVPSDPPQAARDTITTAAKGNRDQPTMDSTFVKVVVKVAIWVTLHEKSRLYPDTVATRPTIAWR